MTGSSPIRILAVDDHPLVREGIAGLVGVQPDMTVIAQAANGREAIQQFRAHRARGVRAQGALLGLCSIVAVAVGGFWIFS